MAGPVARSVAAATYSLPDQSTFLTASTGTSMDPVAGDGSSPVVDSTSVNPTWSHSTRRPVTIVPPTVPCPRECDVGADRSIVGHSVSVIGGENGGGHGRTHVPDGVTGPGPDDTVAGHRRRVLPTGPRGAVAGGGQS